MKDTIYRQAVIDKINEIYCYLSLSYKPKEYETARALFLDIRNAIKTMPSAEPEIIRCKDCKHMIINEKHEAKPMICCFTKMCGTTEPDWFCADGEREDDE